MREEGSYLRMGPRRPIMAAPHPSVINTLREVSCILPAQFRVCRERGSRGPSLLTAGELFWGPASPMSQGQGASREGPPSRMLLIVLSSSRVDKVNTLHSQGKERMGEII